MREPRAEAPRMPSGYGVPKDGSGGERLPWSWAVEQLTAARNYWICTTRGDGSPHAAPVWGIWFDDAVWFGTSPDSLKGRNLARDPRVVIHLESGDDVVILHGEVERFVLNDAIADAYNEKYDYRPDPDETSGEGWYRLRPRRALAWLERDYPKTATRFDFDR